MKLVSDLLARRPSAAWTADADMTVFDMLHLLAKHDVGALMVMAHGKLVGIVSERDSTRNGPALASAHPTLDTPAPRPIQTQRARDVLLEF